MCTVHAQHNSMLKKLYMYNVVGTDAARATLATLRGASHQLEVDMRTPRVA